MQIGWVYEAKYNYIMDNPAYVSDETEAKKLLNKAISAFEKVLTDFENAK